MTKEEETDKQIFTRLFYAKYGNPYKYDKYIMYFFIVCIIGLIIIGNL